MNAIDDLIERSIELFKNDDVRDCDGCTVCCNAPGIDQPDIIKAAGATCQHCTGKGCEIYDKRPGICTGYSCLYQMRVIDDKPSDNGVAWTLQPHECPAGFLLLVGHCFDVKAVLADDKAIATIRRCISESFMITGLAIRDDKICVSAIWPRGPSDVVGLMCDLDQSDPAKLKSIGGSDRPIDLSHLNTERNCNATT